MASTLSKKFLHTGCGALQSRAALRETVSGVNEPNGEPRIYVIKGDRFKFIDGKFANACVPIYLGTYTYMLINTRKLHYRRDYRAMRRQK